MGLRFRKSISIFPGVKLNLSKSGVSVSTGIKGVRGTINSKGKVTTSVGIPGTGVYYTKQFGLNNKKKAATGATVKKEVETPAEEEVKNNTAASAVSTPEVVAPNNQELVEYEQLVKQAQTLHQTCDEPIDWQAVANRPAPEKATSIGAAIRNDSADNDAYTQWQTVHNLAEKVLNKDIDGYLTACQELKPFGDLLDYGSGFTVGTDDANHLTVEFAVRSEEVVPDYVLSVNADQQLTSKPMAVGSYHELVQDYVCSASLRVARDMFATLPVETVTIHAVDNVISRITGQREDQTILSVVFDRETMNKLDMNNIDPSEAMLNFKHNMQFNKQTGFAPVQRIAG